MALDSLTMRETVAFGGAVIKAWRADLRSYIPKRVLRFVEGSPHAVEIRVFRDRLTIMQAGKNEASEATEMVSWQTRTSEIETWLGDCLKSSPKVRSGVNLVLEPDMVLVRQLSYPLVAEHSLTRLFSGQLDALTPWASEDAWVGWSVEERRLHARRIDVQLHVAPKKRLEGLVDVVRSQAGDVTVFSEADLPDGAGLVHLQDLDRQRSAQHRRKILDLGLLGLPVLLALLIIYLPLQLNQNYLTSLKSETKALRADVDKSIALGRSVSDLTAEFTALETQRLENRPIIEILNLLSSALGDDVWLDHFVASSGKVELSGSALDPYAMVSLLQRMDEVKDVRLKSPIVKGRQEGHQSFQIELQMEDRE